MEVTITNNCYHLLADGTASERHSRFGGISHATGVQSSSFTIPIEKISLNFFKNINCSSTRVRCS